MFCTLYIPHMLGFLVLTVQTIDRVSTHASTEENICNACTCEAGEITCDLNQPQRRQQQQQQQHVSNMSIDMNSFAYYGYRKIFIDSTNATLEANAFSRMKKLIILSLNGFPTLSRMPDLSSSLNLSELIIQHSALTTIDASFCNNRRALYKLELSYNQLSSLSSPFDNCIQLSLLDLSHNRLTSMRGMFRRASALTKLVMDNNKLESIGEYDMEHLSNLKELSLAKNHISHVHARAFERLTKLRSLNLDKNQLHALPPVSLMYDSLVFFDISQNPDLHVFPEARHFRALRTLKAHYPYHCCQFQKRPASLAADTLMPSTLPDHETASAASEDNSTFRIDAFNDNDTDAVVFFTNIGKYILVQ